MTSLRLTVLSPEGLKHVAEHKYVPGKYTPLDMILNPFWLQLTEALPKWLAPNLVTLLGFAPMVLSFVLGWRASPDFSEPMPRPLAFFTGLALFFYQTMDAMDGKQARRTGSSTPLGQLFDHGCDCLACFSFHAVGCMILLPGRSWWTLIGQSAMQTGFFLAQWQEYHTGVLRTSFGPVGVTETQYFLIFGALASGLVGPERMRAFFEADVQLPWVGAMRMGLVGVQVWTIFVVVLACICLCKTLPEAARKGGAAGLLCALQQLLPVLVLNLLMFCAWEPSVLQHSARKFFLVTGLLMFYFTAQMILFSMARMRFPTLQWTLLPYLGVALSSWVVVPAHLDAALIVGMGCIVLYVFLWLWTVVDELKTKLGIFAFSLSKKHD